MIPKSNPLFNLFADVWKYSKNNRPKIVLFVTLSVIANAIILIQPIIIGRVFNSVQFSSHDPQLLHQIVRNLSFLVAVTLAFWAFHGTSRVIERQNAFAVRKNFKQILLGQVLDLPAAWHKNHHSGDTIDKVNKAGESLFAFSGNIFTVVQNVVKLVGALAILTFFDWRMSLVAVAASLIAIVSMVKFDDILRHYYAKIFKAENHLASAVHDYISNILTIITLKLKPRVEKEISLRIDDALPIYKKSLVVTEFKWFWVNFLISCMVVGVLILYAKLSFSAKGVIEIGILFTLYSYLQAVGDVFASFAARYGEFVQQEAGVRAVDSIMAAHAALEKTSGMELPRTWKTLEVKDLSFSYETKQGQEITTRQLKGINLSIRKGQKIAFIGESGSGKSTTLGLLRGLHEAETGKVFCDEEELPLGLRYLHSNVSLIPQEPELFNSTILDNITMDLNVDEHDVEDIIDAAQFRGVLDRLPLGLQTFVKEKGVSMSGGEKQRLALARGLLAAKLSTGRRSDLLLLDEPTSNVDAGNELQIYLNIAGIFKNQTIISTIHRLHLLHLFDYIYYFRQGTIIAEGTLQDLQQHPEFQKLWQNYDIVSLFEKMKERETEQTESTPASLAPAGA